MSFFTRFTRDNTRIKRLENRQQSVTRTSSGGTFAGDLAYEPSMLPEWNGDPDTIWQALDQLASRIRALEASSTYTSTLAMNGIEG